MLVTDVSQCELKPNNGVKIPLTATADAVTGRRELSTFYIVGDHFTI